MLIKIRNASDLKDCDVTDPGIYYERRHFMGASAKYLAGVIHLV